MPERATYDYAYVRVVPDQASGEFVNVGVILFCRTRKFLGTRIVFRVERIATLAPQMDLDELRSNLESIRSVCAGHGPIGELGQAESFHWLVAPHNTVVQMSPVHCGLCEDPEEELDRLALALTDGAG